jgi:adenylate cyclase
MNRWRVNLLGRFELRAPSGQEVALGARKSIALLALLAAAPGQRMSRDRIAALLWEDMPDAQARGNLRQLLAATRRPAPFLEADANSVGFSAAMVESDLVAFEAAIAENTPEALERAAALYRADLLDSFSLRDRDFNEWLTGERERLREHAVQLFLRLMKLAAATGAEPAIRWALRILAVDPIHEPAHRGLMELYAAQGRHAAALRQYEHLRETLSRELGTRPEPETDALARRIRDDRRGSARAVVERSSAERDGRLRGETRPLPVHRIRLFEEEGFPAGRPADQATAAPLAMPDKPSAAVLPFTNMSGDPDQEFLADGIAEDVITALSRYPSLFVIARNSCFTYKGRAVNVKQVGRDLGVRYVLEGSVRKAGNRIRVTAQLVEAESGKHVWAEHYNRDLADIFAVQDEITDAVTVAVAPAIDDAERRRAMRKTPESLDVWAVYQRGLWHLSKATPDDNEIAQDLFQQAIDLDPTFAGSYSALALAQLQSAALYQKLDPTEAQKSAEGLARRAVALDGADAQARSCLGWALQARGELEGALVEIERALAMSPNLAAAHGHRGATLIFSGRPKEGLSALETCIRLDPRDPFMSVRLLHIACGLYFSREYEATVEAAKRLILSYPDFPMIYRWPAAALGQLGRVAEAKEALEKAISLAPTAFDMYVRKRVSWFRPEDHAHLLEGLRKAGWKEQ